MNKCFVLLLTLLSVFQVRAQHVYETFDVGAITYSRYLKVDSTDSVNAWQVARPRKSVISTAYSPEFALITDSISACKPNDTSVAYFNIPLTYHRVPNLSMDFYYNLMIDSGDKATIELSGDTGRHWINPLVDDTTYMINWPWSGKPRLDTNTAGWKQFGFDMSRWGFAGPGGIDTFPSYLTADTLLLRFTFITGSDTLNRDGWAIDYITFHYGFREGLVPLVSRSQGLTLSPLPAHEGLVQLNIDEGELQRIYIYDVLGTALLDMPAEGKVANIPISMGNGNYFVKAITSSGAISGRLIVGP